MPTIIKRLGEEDPEDWTRLHDIYERGFLHGGCYSFAIAVHRGLGWPMIGLMKEGEVYHAAVRTSDKRIFDIRGFVSEEEFGVPYGCAPPYKLRDIGEKELQTIKPISEYAIRCTRRIAEVLWPDLPWRETSISELKAFVDELETLCRKHNKWIRSVPGNPPPQLQDGDGHEIGYEVCPAIDEIARTINCCLDY